MPDSATGFVIVALRLAWAAVENNGATIAAENGATANRYFRLGHVEAGRDLYASRES
jgi:hypothetical protein